MARESVQAQLEATEAQIYTMDQHLTERFDRTARIIETLSERLDVLTDQA